MTIENAMTRLTASFHTLDECLAAARTTIVEDHPLDDDSVLIDMFRDPVDDLIGRTGEANSLADQARQATEIDLDTEQARRLLIACHRRYQEIRDLYQTELISYPRTAALVSFGRKRGGEWLHWTRTVREALDRCSPPVETIDRALLDCWQEISAPAGKITIGRC